MASDGPMPQHVIDRIQAATPAPEKQEVYELPQWVKTALVQRAVGDMTYEEAAKPYGRQGKTLANYGRSPAAAKWMMSLQAFLDDPVAMARAILSASALSITADRLMIYEMAKETNIELADKIARDLQDRMGIVAQRSKDDMSGMVINVTLPGGSSLTPIRIESGHKLVQDADFEVEK